MSTTGTDPSHRRERMSGTDRSAAAIEAAQRLIGGCREDVGDSDKCWKPAEYVLWGRLMPPRALGPRCYDHAANHVGHHALARGGAGYAVIHVAELVDAIRDSVTGGNA